MMNHMAKISQDQGVKLMDELLGVNHDSTTDECKKPFGAHIGFVWLKDIFEGGGHR